MAEVTPPTNEDPEQELRYTLNYDAAVTRQIIANRTAEVNASFFLPYLKSGMTLLDCGCGPGSITVGLAKSVAPGQVIGIDIGESQIEQARTLALEQGVNNVRFETGSVFEIPFPDNTFDAVFGHHILQHIPQPLEALNEMRRVLKQGGIAGIKDVSFGGWMLYSSKHEDLMKQVSSIAGQWVPASSGGDFMVGRRFREFLAQSGFKDVRASASYESWGTAEEVKFITSVLASNFRDPDFAEGVISNGISDRGTIDSIANALIEMGDEDGSFIAMSQAEAVGWKA